MISCTLQTATASIDKSIEIAQRKRRRLGESGPNLRVEASRHFQLHEHRWMSSPSFRTRVSFFPHAPPIAWPMYLLSAVVGQKSAVVHAILRKLQVCMCIPNFCALWPRKMAEGSFECGCNDGYLTLKRHQEIYSARAAEFANEYKTKICLERNEWYVRTHFFFLQQGATTHTFESVFSCNTLRQIRGDANIHRISKDVFLCRIQSPTSCFWDHSNKKKNIFHV